MASVVRRMFKQKTLESVTADTSLDRCLGVWDLTMMGIGSMVGSGIYIMTGVAAKDNAGPAIIVSFIAAAIVILMVMANYTELASSLHRTGSTYLYMYLTLGELPAFIIGFATLLLIILGGATNGRAWSAYVDSLFHNAVSNYTMTHIAHWDVGSPIAEYPDFVGATVIIIVTLVVAVGAKCSSRFISFFAVINVLILIFVSVVGFIYADINNWTNPDTGGFAPFGIQGIIQGSASCFWAFSGFEVISMAVEETRNSRRDIPLSSVLVLVIVTVLYVCTSSAITLITSYENIDESAPLPSAFAAQGLSWAHSIVAIGPICGLTTTMVSSLYGFSRMAYAIAEDGLLFAVFANVNECSQVPLFSIIFSGFSMALVALFLNLADIISFSVNIVLISYILVGICVIILRYKPSTSSSMRQIQFDSSPDNEDDMDASDDISSIRNSNISGGLKQKYSSLSKIFGSTPGRWPKIALSLLIASIFLLSLLITEAAQNLRHGVWWAVILSLLLVLIISLLILSFHAHNQVEKGSSLQVPCVPFIPCLSIMCCVLLLFSNSHLQGWIGTAILLAITVIIYFIYGIRYSKLRTETHHLDNVLDNGEAAVKLLEAHDDEDEL